MSNVHGKEIPLQYVTVKVPGQKPRGSRTVQSQQSTIHPHASESNFGSINSTSVSTSSSTSNIMSGGVTGGSKGEKVLLTSYEMLSGDNIMENNNDIEKVNVNNAHVSIKICKYEKFYTGNIVVCVCMLTSKYSTSLAGKNNP